MTRLVENKHNYQIKKRPLTEGLKPKSDGRTEKNVMVSFKKNKFFLLLVNDTRTGSLKERAFVSSQFSRIYNYSYFCIFRPSVFTCKSCIGLYDRAPGQSVVGLIAAQ
jgi:hypothetical protein